jgi:hypothetical protein
MPSKSNNDERHHGDDRFAQKLKLYANLDVIPQKVSRANSAVILIAGVCVGGLVGLAWCKAPWYSYLVLAVVSVIYCGFAVWREKDDKSSKQKESG